MSPAGRYAGGAVLVTGASGFIGSWLAERLLDEGARVIVPRRAGARSWNGPGSLRPSRIEERCEVVEMDLLDLGSLVRVVNERGVDSVFHLAAQTLVDECQQRPLEAFEINAIGTSNLLEACRLLEANGSRPRIVVASTYHVYGHPEAAGYTEEMPLLPRNPYEASKACGDMLARCYAASYGSAVAVTRLANVYGGGDLSFSRLVPGVARSLVAGERPVIKSDGTPERDFIYAGDAIDAYLAVADSLTDPANAGRAWNAGSGTAVSIAELVGRMTAASGKHLEPEILGVRDPGTPVDRQRLESAAIERELGWRASTSLDDGMRATYEWYEEHLGRAGGP